MCQTATGFFMDHAIWILVQVVIVQFLSLGWRLSRRAGPGFLLVWLLGGGGGGGGEGGAVGTTGRARAKSQAIHRVSAWSLGTFWQGIL
jgi:hypothetical protein